MGFAVAACGLAFFESAFSWLAVCLPIFWSGLFAQLSQISAAFRPCAVPCEFLYQPVQKLVNG
jgi:hypothetical protein